MKKSFLLILTCLLIGIVPIKGQAVAELEEAEILMGNTTKLYVSVPLPTDSTKVVFPMLKDAELQKKKFISLLNDTIELYVAHKKALEEENGKYFLRYDLTVQSFDSGYYTLPSMEFLIAGEKIHSNPVKLKVLPVKVKADDKLDDFSDIASPFEVNPDLNSELQKSSSILFWILFGIVCLLAICLVIYWFLRNKGVSIIGRHNLSPAETALQKLKKLQDQNLTKRGRNKEFYTKLTEIIRVYLKKQFGIRTFEKTSSEILFQIENNNDLSGFHDLLKSIFETSDFVKFAKVNPSEIESSRCISDAIRFVKLSRPIEKQSDKKGGQS